MTYKIDTSLTSDNGSFTISQQVHDYTDIDRKNLFSLEKYMHPLSLGTVYLFLF